MGLSAQQPEVLPINDEVNDGQDKERDGGEEKGDLGLLRRAVPFRRGVEEDEGEQSTGEAEVDEKSGTRGSQFEDDAEQEDSNHDECAEVGVSELKEGWSGVSECSRVFRLDEVFLRQHDGEHCDDQQIDYDDGPSNMPNPAGWFVPVRGLKRRDVMAFFHEQFSVLPP